MSYDTRLMKAAALRVLPFSRQTVAVVALVAACAALRFCHLRLLWADEDYHLAAALEMLHGSLPYRDFWYDKPPLNAIFYLFTGARDGWPLRSLDAAYVLLACWSAYRLARMWWGENEGRIAAIFTGFFLTFYFPSAVISFAADALMVVPHLWTIYFARLRRPLAAGACCGLAFLFNIKAVFVLAVCLAWMPAEALLLATGFAGPVLGAWFTAIAFGIWHGYVQQVWQWGVVYARQSPATHPFALGISRTANWLGFHAALACSAAVALLRSSRDDRSKLGIWIALSFAAVCLGSRFDPRYFLQLLPPLAVGGARGAAILFERYDRKAALAVGLLLLIPLGRFGPRYAILAGDAMAGRTTAWADAALDEDSRQAARTIRATAHADDTLFVWGYRSDLYVYTRLTSDSRFWDSQPLTGVPADRHLHTSQVLFGGVAERNRQEFIRSRPTFFVDGLGLLNPSLRPEAYPEIRTWIGNYELIGRTKLSLIYRRRALPSL